MATNKKNAQRFAALYIGAPIFIDVRCCWCGNVFTVPFGEIGVKDLDCTECGTCSRCGTDSSAKRGSCLCGYTRTKGERDASEERTRKTGVASG